MASSNSQSWSSYLLSTYTTSVSPDPAVVRYAASSDSPTIAAPSPKSASSPSSSPWGPFTKTGRGGAGNFTWQSSLPGADVEAGGDRQSSLSDRQLAAAQVEARAQSDALKNKTTSEFAHTGRGGAGNYTSTSDVPTTPSPPPSTAGSRIRTPSPDNTPPKIANVPVPPALVDSYLAAKSGYYGRGGAGNFNTEAARQAQREAEEKKKAMEEEMRKKVQEDVESGLSKPPGALLPEGRLKEVSRIV